MKKIIIALITVIIFSTNTYAETIDIAAIANEADTFCTGSQLDDIQEVGNGWLVTNTADSLRYFTEDFISYRAVDVYDDKESFSGYGSRYGFPGSMDEIIWVDGVYMARSTTYDNIGKSPVPLNGVRYLYILNTDFELITKIEFDNYVRQMSYVNGVYYVCVNNKTAAYKSGQDIINEVYSSTDLEQWTLREELKNVPLTNGSTAVMLKGLNIYTFENDCIGSQIVFENVQIAEVITNKKLSPIPAIAIRMRSNNAIGRHFFAFGLVITISPFRHHSVFSVSPNTVQLVITISVNV